MRKTPIIDVNTGRRIGGNTLLDEIGDYVHEQLQTCGFPYYRGNKKTRYFVRKIVEKRFGKPIAKKFSDIELEDAWYQYEPQ